MLAFDEEVKKSKLNVLLDNDEAREIMQKFEDKIVTPHNIDQFKAEVDRDYTNLRRVIQGRFMNIVNNIKDYPFFSEIFPGLDEKPPAMSASTWNVAKSTWTFERTKTFHIDRLEDVAKDLYEMMVSEALHNEIQRQAVEKLIDLVKGGGVTRRWGIPTKRGMDTKNIAAQQWDLKWKEVGSKPRAADVAIRVNDIIVPLGYKMVTSSNIVSYAKAGYQQLVRTGAISIEDVTKRGINLKVSESKTATASKLLKSTVDVIIDEVKNPTA